MFCSLASMHTGQPVCFPLKGIDFSGPMNKINFRPFADVSAYCDAEMAITCSCSILSVVQPHFLAYQQIVHYFGNEILLESGEINREALGNIIFSHPEKRQLLNSITHPEIQKMMLKQIFKYFVLGYRYVILDIPLLFESTRLTKFMKHTILVYSDPQTQMSRLMKRNGLAHSEAEARIASQLPLDEKRKLADHIIDNSGDRESMRRQVLRLHSRLEDSLDFLLVRLVAVTVVAGIGGLVCFLLRHFFS
uniref:Dephospho-CoA kinase domain containing n=1 Tax=Pelusios castaneus TaxID=367368 RepID=A0A8C8S1F6_9SAUR